MVFTSIGAIVAYGTVMTQEPGTKVLERCNVVNLRMLYKMSSGYRRDYSDILEK